MSGTEFRDPGSPSRATWPADRRAVAAWLAHPDDNDGVELLRRGYNFTDGTDGLGRLDAGLFFLAYVRNPVDQYVPMQTKLARDDLLSEYLLHTGSALFAVPAGVVDDDDWIGRSLFT